MADLSHTPDQPDRPDALSKAPASADVGLGLDKGRQREKNEDSLGSAILRRGPPAAEVYVVADGMGGHDSGEMASRLAVQSMLQALTGIAQDASQPLNPEAWLAAAIAGANASVRAKAAEVGSNMGSTLVAAIVSGPIVHIANVGDSRAYLLSPREIRRITHDQSFIQSLLDAGAIKPEQAETHPYKNILTQAMGQNEKVSPDMFEETLDPDEMILLCTDGLWKTLGDERIWEIVRATTSPQAGCRALIEAANAEGGEDNITAVLIRPGPAA